MSVTTPSDVDTSIPEIWGKGTLRKQLRKGFWSRFAGSEMSGSVMIRKAELLNNPGDLIHIQVTQPLSGAGVSGDTATLEGNEENLTTSEIQCSPTFYRHGVRRNRRANKKSIMDLREESKFRLAEWGAAKSDTIRFSQFASTSGADVPDGSYTPNIYVVGGGTGVDDIGSTDTFDVDAVRHISYLLSEQGAERVEVDGMEVYFAVISPQMEYDLKNDTAYDNAVKDAALRGSTNPIFTGALAMIDGVVLLPHFRVPKVTNSGSKVVAKAVAFGKEAFVEALDEDVNWAEDTFDYGHELGVAYGFAFQPRRGLEQNSLQVYALSAAPA